MLGAFVVLVESACDMTKPHVVVRAVREAPTSLIARLHPGSCRNFCPHRNDVVLRMNDAVDLTGQRLEGLLLFGVIGVAVIGAADASHDVPQAALGMIRGTPAGSSANARCGGDRAGSSPTPCRLCRRQS